MKRLLFCLLLSGVAWAGGNKGRDVLPPKEPARLDMPTLWWNGNQWAENRVMRTLDGWALTGTRPEAYEIVCDRTFGACTVPILRTRAWTREPFGMGSLTHAVDAKDWKGHRVEFRGLVRPGSVDGWAGLWMRVDGPGGKVLAFDNMQNRALRGTGGYDWYAVVLDVPENAERITFGVLLHGPGAVYVNELRLSVVNEGDSQVTDLLAPLRAGGSLSAGK